MTFRILLTELREVTGKRPLWPILLGAILCEKFEHERRVEEGYSGPVFINRDAHKLTAGEREERLVANLYREAQHNGGCVSFENEKIWLLGYQWPTQGGLREKGRRADLVGLMSDGSLCVFEAKRASGDAPMIAIVEGLDYLACLLRSKNFDKIQAGFRNWRLNRNPPEGFEGLVPRSDKIPTLMILAPEAYFTGRTLRSTRSKGWPELAMASGSMMKSVRIRFAATDFKSTKLWAPPIPQTP